MGSDVRFLCGLNKKKIVLEKFVRFGIYSYLCSILMCILLNTMMMMKKSCFLLLLFLLPMLTGAQTKVGISIIISTLLQKKS